MNTNVTTIELDERTGKLRVRCPVWANEVLEDLPKSWSKAQKAWLVPVSTTAMEFLQRNLIGPGLASITNEALQVLKNTKPPAWKTEGFPSWYKFKTQPRKHQKRAYKYYGMKSLALFMIMRAGKTKVVIDMASAQFIEQKIEALLVIPKLSVRKTWQSEFTAHCPIDYDLLLPYTDKRKRFEGWCAERGLRKLKVCVVGTESFSQGGMDEMAQHFLDVHSGGVHICVDESWQIEGKSERTDVCIELARHQHVKYRTITNGSALDDTPLKLFWQYEFLDTNIIGIGDYLAFRNRYAVMGGYRVEIRPGVFKPTKVVGYQRLEELMAKLAPYTFEVGEDELDLPDKVYERRHVQATAEQRALYQQIRRQGEYTWKNENVVLKNILELELRLHQLAGGHTATRRKDERGREVTVPHQVIRPKANPKIREVLDVVTEAGKKQGIVWCAYMAEIQEVADALFEAGIKVTTIHGKVDEDERERRRLAFQKGEFQYIVGNTATGGAGLDMSAATVMIFYSNTNKIVDRTQSEMRPQAVGKKASLLIVDIIMEGTVDEIRMEAIEQKQDLGAYVKARLREMVARIRGEG